MNPVFVIFVIVIPLLVAVVLTVSYFVAKSNLKKEEKRKTNRTDKRTRLKIVSNNAGGYSLSKMILDHSGILKRNIKIKKYGGNPFHNKYGYEYKDIKHLVQQNVSYAISSLKFQNDGVRSAFFINENLFLIFSREKTGEVIKVFQKEECDYDYIKNILYRKDWITNVDSSIVETFVNINKRPNVFNAAIGGEIFGPLYSIGEMMDYRQTAANIVSGNFSFEVKNEDNVGGKQIFALDTFILKSTSYKKEFVTFLRFNSFVNEYFETVETKATVLDRY